MRSLTGPDALRVHLGARARVGAAIESGPVSVGAAEAESAARGPLAVATAWLADGAEAVLEPAHPDLLEAPIAGAAKHVGRNDGVARASAGDKLRHLITDVAGGGGHSKGADAAGDAVVSVPIQVSNNFTIYRPIVAI